MPGKVIGGGGFQYQKVVEPAAQSQDGTMAFVGGLVNKYAAGQIEQKQKQMFIAGMQRVATGEALKDIKQDDPPFAQIFGPTASVMGASAMAQVKNVDDYVNSQYANMESLAQMSPEEAGKQMVGGMEKYLTGDTATDTVIQAKMVENLGPLMKAQTKANYAWTQGNMSRQYGGMVNAAGGVLQGAASELARGTMSREDFDNIRMGTLRSMQPIAGMSAATYRASLVEAAKLQMMQGNHWLDRTLTQAGLYNEILDSKELAELEATRRSAENNTAQEFGFNQYGAQLAEIAGRAPSMAPADIAAAYNRVNQAYMDQTGATRGLVDTAQMVTAVKSSYSRLYRMQDKLSLLQAKAQYDDRAKAQAAQYSSAQLLMGAGNFGRGSGISKDDYDNTAIQTYQALVEKNGPDVAAQYVKANYDNGGAYVIPALQNMIEGPIRAVGNGAMPGPEFQRAVELMTTLRNQGGIVADAYISTENSIKLDRYTALVNANEEPAVAARLAFDKPLTKGAPSSPEDVDKVLDKVIDKDSGSFWQGVPKMDERNRATVNAAMRPYYDTYLHNGYDEKTSAKKAMAAVRSQIDMVGSYSIRKLPGQAPLAEMVGFDQPTVDAGIQQFLAQQAVKLGIKGQLPAGLLAPAVSGTGDLFDVIPVGTAAAAIDNARKDLPLKGGPVLGVMSGVLANTSRFLQTDADAVVINRVRDSRGEDGKPVAFMQAIITVDGGAQSIYFRSDELKMFLEGQLNEGVTSGHH